MMTDMRSGAEGLIPTRYSLLSRLQNWDDQESWKDFFDTYWRLIYTTAKKSGLTDAEAQDVVQETVICVAKDLHKFKRDRERGSFKGWLRNIIRWRIADQLRKRAPAGHSQEEESLKGEFETPEWTEIPDPGKAALETLWDEEWHTNLFLGAVDRVKRQVREEHYQMFDLYVVRGWPVVKVARTLGVSVGRIYLAKHRISALIKKEIHAMEKRPF